VRDMAKVAIDHQQMSHINFQMTWKLLACDDLKKLVDYALLWLNNNR